MKCLLVVAVVMSQVTPDAGEATFAKALESYVAVHRSAAVGLRLADGDVTSPDAQQTMNMFRDRIRERRATANVGDILGPMSRTIRETVTAELAGPAGRATFAAISDSNVHGVQAAINRPFPPGLPRATMPGQLLAKLPRLPAELEYRFLGRSLILVDSRADLVADVLPNVLPARLGPLESQRKP